MENNFYKNLIQDSRHIRNDFFQGKWINEYIDNIKNQMDITQLECFVINSMERRTCFSTFSNTECIVFDNYVIEILDYLNYLYDHQQYRDEGMRKFYFKMAAEIHYLEGEYNASVFLYNNYRKLKVPYKLSFQNEECLFCQQAFLFFHELEHYLIAHNKELVDTFVINSFTESANGELGITLKEYMKNDNSLEEFCCDSQAAICAIALTIDKYSTDPVDAAFYILLAQNNIFILSEIERQERYKNKEKEVFDYDEYSIRVLYLGFYILELLEAVYAMDKKRILDELQKLTGFFIESCRLIYDIHDEEFIKQLCYCVELGSEIPQKTKEDLYYLLLEKNINVGL